MFGRMGMFLKYVFIHCWLSQPSLVEGAVMPTEAVAVVMPCW